MLIKILDKGITIYLKNLLVAIFFIYLLIDFVYK
jgi:hypothetical protein